MASLAELFNPTFFIILGIVTLLIVLAVVYFESKMREQNHKIASMLSLVSTLAEDMTGVKMGLTHLAVTTGNGGVHHDIQHTPFSNNNLGSNYKEELTKTLIEVSDDESEDDEEQYDEDATENNTECEDDEINDDNNDDNNDDDDTYYDNDDDEDAERVKIIKLNISEESHANSFERDNNLDFETTDDLEEDIDEIPEVSEQYTQEMLSLKYDDTKEENQFIGIQTNDADLKTISINLGEEQQTEQTEQTEHIEYKKLQLTKLRSIAIEKGLTNNAEAHKLKKQELLKLLGVE